MKSQGSAGFGTLILFIAAVVTAALAAYVIINTVMGAQQKAAAVAQQAKERVGTAIEFVRVEGLVNSTTNTINSFYIYVRLAPGASPINLSQTQLIYITSVGQQAFRFNVTGGYQLVPSLSFDASGALLTKGILGPGDLAVLNVNVTYALRPSQAWSFLLVPPNGQPSSAYGVAPSSFLNSVEVLY